MYRSPVVKHEIDLKPAEIPTSESSTIAVTSHKQSPLSKKKPPKGAVNKLIYGLHKAPMFSEKGEAKGAVTAMLSEIHSPPVESAHEPISESTPSEPTIASIKILTKTIIPDLETPRNAEAIASHEVKEKHVEFILPDDSPEVSFSEGELSPEVSEDFEEHVDNGSKENLFIPNDEYGTEEEYEDELVYEEEDSVLMRQYPSDEEEEPYSDEIQDDVSDVDDSDLMRRLEEKYGKLEVVKDHAAEPEEDDGDWTSISPSLVDGRLVGSQVPSF